MNKRQAGPEKATHTAVRGLSTRRDFIKVVAAAMPAAAGVAFAVEDARPASSQSLGAEGALQITPLQGNLLRVRHIMAGGETKSLNERVGFVTPGQAREKEKAGPTARATSGDALGWELLSPAGEALSVFRLVPNQGGGFELTATAQAQEGWHGLGFHRQKMELHRLTMRWERTYHHKEATVPFFFSTAGYGVFSNAPWPQTFDFTQPHQWSLRSAKGACDLFLIYGPSPREILDGYTKLCGRPQLPPRWALDPLYICRYFENQAGAEAIARAFRERDIPCGMLGLEPGWEEVPYSMRWKWSGKRFPEPRQMIQRLHALGFHFELWESGTAPDAGFTDAAARQAWFQARVGQSLDLGVDFFKQDDPYPRGITSEELQRAVVRKSTPRSELDAEAGNIANSLYSQTAMQQMEGRTGHRGLIIFTSYFASVAAHRWPTAWASDFPSGTGLLNASLSGHGMVSRDMEVASAEGIHFGYLTPFTILDSWAYYHEPWLFPPHLEASHRFYAKLRLRLGPHLYSAAWASHLAGWPIMRPMPLEHPGDPAVGDISSQHYLGDGLLVGQGHRTYLPAGRWIDYWTGASESSAGAWHESAWTEPACGPLWVRAGSIIVTRPVTAHAFAEDDSVLIAEVFPGEHRVETKLYEDDGVSLAYRDGRWRLTVLACRLEGGLAEVTIQRLSDTLKAENDRRGYLLRIHTQLVPAEVTWQGQPLLEKDSYADLVNAAGQRGWCRDAQAPYVWVKADPHWHFTSDQRGARDPEHDTPRWEGEPLEANGRLQMRFGSQAMRPRPQPPEKPQEADTLCLMLNPPERIALKDGSWLPHLTTVYAWLEAGGKPVAADGIEVRLEVLSKEGNLLRAESQRTTKGRVAFGNQAYIAGDTLFRLRAQCLRAVESSVRPAPPI